MQRKANCRPLITSVSIVDRKESKEMKPQIFGSRKKKREETQDIERKRKTWKCQSKKRSSYYTLEKRRGEKEDCEGGTGKMKWQSLEKLRKSFLAEPPVEIFSIALSFYFIFFLSCFCNFAFSHFREEVMYSSYVGYGAQAYLPIRPFIFPLMTNGYTSLVPLTPTLSPVAINDKSFIDRVPLKIF